MEYPEIIIVNNIKYYFVRAYTTYGLYLCEYGYRETFTPCQIHDIYKHKYFNNVNTMEV